ncbi:MAG: hypothetical protein AAFY39_13595, partial [Pseudomonadota bacterium]
SLAVNDRHVSTHRAKIAALHFLDRGQEAREAAKAFLQVDPDFSLERYRITHPVTEQKLGRKVIDALRASGVN